MKCIDIKKGEHINEVICDGKTYKVENGEINLPKLPGDVKYRIEKYAFENSDIRHFDFSNVYVIGDFAFNQSAIESVDAPNVYIHGYAFHDCSNLKKARISFEGAASCMFKGCNNLETVEFLGYTEDEYPYFLSGAKIKNLILPSTLEYLNLLLFENASIEKLSLPKNTIFSIGIIEYGEQLDDEIEDFSCLYGLSDQVLLTLLELEPNLYFKLPNECFEGHDDFLDECNQIIYSHFMKNVGNIDELKKEFCGFKLQMDNKKEMAKLELSSDEEENFETYMKKHLGLEDNDIECDKTTTSKAAPKTKE